MERLDGWEDRLKSVVERQRRAPFHWGQQDCATFAADCIDALTGRDVLGTLRGSYASRIAARARMRARGWRTLREAAAAVLEPAGAKPIPPRFARVGDIGVTDCGALCVRLPDGFAARHADGNLVVAPHVAAAWAIG